MTRIKKYKSLILTITVLTGITMTSAFCSRGLRVVPEISKNLFDQDVLDLTDKSPTCTLLSHQDDLVVVASDGKISRWNPDAKIVNDLFNLNKNVDLTVMPFHHDNFLMLKTAPSQGEENSIKPEFVVFNLKEMKKTAVLNDIAAQTILGLDGEMVVYTTPTGQAIIFNYHTGTRLQVLEPTTTPNIQEKKEEGDKKNPPDQFFNCDYSGDNILVLSSRILYVYNRPQKNLTAFPLKYPAASGFLKVGNSIYYGSQTRELIKLSTQSNKVSWHFLLAETLRQTPTPMGQYIVIIPEDNNIYFFNKNGNLYWWEQLNSIKGQPVISMKENAVVFLLDKRIKFFNYKNKRVITYTLQDWMTIQSNPANIGEHIYVVIQNKAEGVTEEIAEDGQETETVNTPLYTRLLKIGNNYTVEINAEPDFIWPKGKSIKFDLSNINFIHPSYTVQIFKSSTADDSGLESTEPVFTRVLSKKDKPTFVWVPGEYAEYRMIIQVDSENKKGVTVEKTISTIDINKTLHDYYYEIQRQCDNTAKTDGTIKISSDETK